MTNPRILFLFLALLLYPHLSYTQLAIGHWRDHYPYSKTIDVCLDDQVVYCATPYGLFTFDRTDNSVERLNKSNKLSDTPVSAINFDPASKTLIVGYENGNLDLISEGKTRNLADIKNTGLVGNKSIHDIYLFKNTAYLATGFGVVELDLVKKEIKNTFYIGEQGSQTTVYQFISDGAYFYALTPDGIRFASINDPFLVNFSAWSLLSDLPPSSHVFKKLLFFQGHTLVLEENENFDNVWIKKKDSDLWEIFPDFEEVQVWNIGSSDQTLALSKTYSTVFFNGDLEAIKQLGWINSIEVQVNALAFDSEQTAWIANNQGGLMHARFDGWSDNLYLNGPAHSNVRRMACYNNNLWVASGGVDQSWTNNYDYKGIYGMVDETWHLLPKYNGFTGADYMDVTINPSNNKEVFLGSWFDGLIRVKDKKIVAIYDENTPPILPSDFGGAPRLAVGGVDYDSQGNLWFSTTYSDQPLYVLQPNDEIIGYTFSNQITESQIVSDVLATRQGYIWTILPRGRGLLVFDHNNTLDKKSDDNFKILTSEEGQGGLPSGDVYSIEEDLDGEIWVGTLQGVAVFYVPEAIFTSNDFDAQQILIEQDGNIQILLETEAVTAITVDGANRKWIGTQTSGVFLMDPDGIEQIHHFTVENSPLPSNNIEDISINHETGEVFFATFSGIVSYRSDAANFDPNMADVKVFPNPVREDYDGLISIDGLARDCDVKITDAQGNAVYQDISNGGRTTWDGKNFNGERVASGIYLVFATTADGKATQVAKIAFIH